MELYPKIVYLALPPVVFYKKVIINFVGLKRSSGLRSVCVGRCFKNQKQPRRLPAIAVVNDF